MRVLKKLDFLIIRSFIGPFIATFFITLFVLVLQFFWLYIDDIVGKGVDMLTVFRLILYVSATLVPLALPLAVLLSSIMTFGNLGETFELIAIKSAGIPLLRFMRPLLFISLVICYIAFLFNNYIIPVANLKMNTLKYDIIISKPAFDIKEGVFYDKIEGYVIKIGKKDKDDSTIHSVVIYEQNPSAQQDNIIIADRGKMVVTPDKHSLVFVLQDGWTYQEGRGERMSTTTEFIRMGFKEYKKVLDLSSFKLNKTDDSAFKNNYQMLTLQQLGKDIDSLKKMEAIFRARSATSFAIGMKFPKYLDTTGWDALEKAPSVSSAYLLDKPKQDSFYRPVETLPIHPPAVTTLPPNAPGSHPPNQTINQSANHPGQNIPPNQNAHPSLANTPFHQALRNQANNTFAHAGQPANHASQPAPPSALHPNSSTPHPNSLTRAMSKGNTQSMPQTQNTNPVPSATAAGHTPAPAQGTHPAPSTQATSINHPAPPAVTAQNVPVSQTPAVAQKPVPAPPKKTPGPPGFREYLPDSVRTAVLDRTIGEISSAKSALDQPYYMFDSQQSELRVHSIAWHEKLTLSVACLVMFLIGAPLGSIIRKGGIGMPLIIAVIFFVIFFLLNNFGKKFVKEGVLGPIAGMWMATYVLTPIGLFLVYKAMHDSQLFNKEFYFRIIRAIRNSSTKSRAKKAA